LLPPVRCVTLCPRIDAGDQARALREGENNMTRLTRRTLLAAGATSGIFAP
jgi:hypothetical protein